MAKKVSSELSYDDFPEIANLVDFLQENERRSTGFVTKQRILNNIDGWGKVINQ